MGLQLRAPFLQGLHGPVAGGQIPGWAEGRVLQVPQADRQEGLSRLHQAVLVSQGVSEGDCQPRLLTWVLFVSGLHSSLCCVSVG